MLGCTKMCMASICQALGLAQRKHLLSAALWLLNLSCPAVLHIPSITAIHVRWCRSPPELHESE